jgi:hypothetical protein
MAAVSNQGAPEWPDLKQRLRERSLALLPPGTEIRQIIWAHTSPKLGALQGPWSPINAGGQVLWVQRQFYDRVRAADAELGAAAASMGGAAG